MVTNLAAALAAVSLLLAQRDMGPILKQLDPPRRAAVMMALLALVLTGLLLVTCVMIGARWVRRTARQIPKRGRKDLKVSAAENRRLRDSLQSVLPEVKTDDTIQVSRRPGETKVDM